MATLAAIHNAGQSIADSLQRGRTAQISNIPCEFWTTGKLIASPPPDPSLVVLLYAVTIHEHSRSAARTSGPHRGSVPLGLALHLLLTPWSTDPALETTLLGWGMRHLYTTPLLDRSMLTPADAWEDDDRIQIVPAEKSIEEIIRIWEGLRQPFRLSAAYEARVVRIDVEPGQEYPPVVARRIGYVPYDGGSVAPLVDAFHEQNHTAGDAP